MFLASWWSCSVGSNPLTALWQELLEQLQMCRHAGQRQSSKSKTCESQHSERKQELNASKIAQHFLATWCSVMASH